MSEQRLRLVCPKCDNVLASVPKDRRPAGPLICSNCGAKVYPETFSARLKIRMRQLLRGGR